VFRSVLVAFAGNNVLPARAGEVLRMGYLARLGEAPVSAAVAIVVVERMMDMGMLAVFALATIGLAVMDVSAPLMLYGVTGVLLTGLGLAVAAARRPDLVIAGVELAARPLPDRFGQFVVRQASGVSQGLAALSSITAVVMVVVWTFLFWLSGVAGIALWIWAFGLDVPWYASIVVLVFVGVGGMLPSSPGAVGTWHYFARSGLTSLGVSASTAASFAIVGHFMAIVPWTVISLPILLAHRRRVAVTEANP
jgi:uncharacterized protein (TIRG00374 family)